MTKRSIIITTSIILGILVVITILFGAVFRVRKVKVNFTQDFYYKAQINEIISASNIKKGEGIFSVDTTKAKENIEKEFPYARVDGVNLTSFISVTISLSTRQPLYYAVQEGIYYILDEDCKVLDIINDSEEAGKYIWLENAFEIGQDVEVGDFLNGNNSSACTNLYLALYSNAKLKLRDVDNDGILDEHYLEREDMLNVLDSVEFATPIDDLTYGKIDKIILTTSSNYGVKIEITDTSRQLDLKVNMAFSALRKLIEEDEKNGTQLAKTGSIIVRYSYDENNAISLACEYRQS